MIILFLVLLAIIWTPCVVVWLLRAQRGDPDLSTHPGQASTARPSSRKLPAYRRPSSTAEAITVGDDRSAWRALDDRQLTRLLMDATPPPTTTVEEDPSHEK